MFRYYRTLTCVASILVAVSVAEADVVTYDMSYDPTTGVTALANHADSVGNLEFHTSIGMDQGMALFVAPGSTVTVDSSGAVSGQLAHDTSNVRNKHIGDVSADTSVALVNGTGLANVTWTNPDGSPGGFVLHTGDSKGTIPKGSKNAHITVGTNTDIVGRSDAVWTLHSGTEAIYLSPAWSGPPDQLNIELLLGSMTVVDDTNAWTSVFTPPAIPGDNIAGLTHQDK